MTGSNLPPTNRLTMLADRKFWLTVMLLGTAGVVAADEELPDMEFLEYLGMWEESDEEWLALADDEALGDDEALLAADSDERSDPAPEGEESRENDDES